jgi:hypothetical protein
MCLAPVRAAQRVQLQVACEQSENGHPQFAAIICCTSGSLRQRRAPAPRDRFFPAEYRRRIVVVTFASRGEFGRRFSSLSVRAALPAPPPVAFGALWRAPALR